MSFLRNFIKIVSDAPSVGAAASKGRRRRDTNSPKTMVDWKSYVDDLPRSERSKQYPGMHKDLIPTFEMIMSKGLGGRPGSDAAKSSQGQPAQNFRVKTDEEIDSEDPACPRLKREAKQLDAKHKMLTERVGEVEKEIDALKSEIEQIKTKFNIR